MLETMRLTNKKTQAQGHLDPELPCAPVNLDAMSEPNMSVCTPKLFLLTEKLPSTRMVPPSLIIPQ